MPSFRLATIFWAFALVGAGMAAFGTIGIVFAAGVILAWARAFRMLPMTLFEFLVVVCILLVLAALLLPAIGASREYARFTHCSHNLLSVAKALSLYADKHGAFPAARPREDSSRPAVSWRVALLPQLDLHSLRDAYRPDEPWDSANNMPIAQTDIDVYASPNDPPASSVIMANYFAVVGPRAAWLPDRGRVRDEFKDGFTHTILLIESAGHDVPWSKPEDLTFDEALDLLTQSGPGASMHHRWRDQDFFYNDPTGSGVHVAFADGKVRFLPLPISKELATALLTVDGGEQVDWSELDRLTLPQFDYARCYALAVFAALSILPAFRLRPRAPQMRDGDSL